jgi:sulfatase maturation enzyme AslB (radical SAM superfamily)
MHFVLKISKLCNLRCTYCSEYDELGRKERMPLDALEFFVQSVSEFALKQRSLGRGPKEFCFVLQGVPAQVS